MRAVLGKEYYPRWAILLVGFILTALIGLIDYYTGHELALSSLYVLPVGVVTWYASRGLGVFMASVSAAVWILADVGDGQYASVPVLAANTIIRLSLFLIIVYVLSALHKAMLYLREVSRFDTLTGALNSAFFYKSLEDELERLTRYGHALTLVYLDLDGFKAVNDGHGHLAGDRVLHQVADSAKARLRKTDLIARMGGDEFAFLLPETEEEAAQAVVSEVMERLNEEMREGGWPVTFSVGVVTCHEAPASSEELVKMADDLMYSVKLAAKNGVKYASLGCAGQDSALCDEGTLLRALRV